MDSVDLNIYKKKSEDDPHSFLFYNLLYLTSSVKYRKNILIIFMGLTQKENFQNQNT